jgi:hypothetical protein
MMSISFGEESTRRREKYNVRKKREKSTYPRVKR